MALVVRETHLFIHNLHTRMPFRYGIASMTAVPHVFMLAVCEVDGQVQAGIAADNLVPKWFTKDPEQDFAAEVQEMLAVIRSAGEIARGTGTAGTVFDLWQAIYTQQKRWGEEKGYPPLLWNFGVSLVERAVIDAFCRARGVPFGDALRSGLLGLRLGEIHPQLSGDTAAELLPSRPLRTVALRHTVGLTDPLTDAEIRAEDRLQDGLPQSLEASVRAYGLKFFKIKVCGDPRRDIERLRQVAGVLERAGPKNLAFTLDGNEQYGNIGSFRAFWEELHAERGLASFLSRLLFVEQPLHRKTALSPETGADLTGWSDRPPVIIDESDSRLESLPDALACGYCGTSHKNCKGIFKGIANACLLEHHRRAEPDACWILSGEDLVNVGPVALLQDLAAAANLGIEHVERNGHHYFAGLSMFPQELQRQVLEHHPDLYHQSAGGFASLDIKGGVLRLDTLLESAFGPEFLLDPAIFEPAMRWNFSSLVRSDPVG